MPIATSSISSHSPSICLPRPRICQTTSSPSYTNHRRRCIVLSTKTTAQLLTPSHGGHVLLLSSTNTKQQRSMVVSNNSLRPAGSPLVPSGHPQWKTWIIGGILTILLPFLKSKWGPLLKLKNEVETVLQIAESTAEAVEKVAEVIKEVAEEAAEHLPEGGRLKAAATIIEHISEEVAKDAHLLDDAIDKIQEMEEKAESFVDSAFDHASKEEGSKEAE